jgi:hypothetical protein
VGTFDKRLQRLEDHLGIAEARGVAERGVAITRAIVADPALCDLASDYLEAVADGDTERADAVACALVRGLEEAGL